MIYRFDNCELDLGQIVLRRDGEVIQIEPQVFDLLRCLIDRRGQLVTKEELLDVVWGDRFVSESALTTRVKSARRAVGDDGSLQRVIRTVHGKGYMFISPVTEADLPDRVGGHSTPPAPQPVSTLVPFAHSSLPLSVHSLIGRDELLDTLTADLATSRLVTLVGTGGVGKTSVGLELARRVVADRSDGVVLVELVTVGDDGALAAIATALDVNVRQHAAIDDAIIDMLRPRNLLLVIDNCEHLIEPIAQLVEQILRTAPGVTVLATSREPLAIAGEMVHVIEPLDVTGLDDLSLGDLEAVPAVALFLDRARAADARFELTSDTAPAVAEICRRLDGIPLALELAASRTHAIDVQEIARRLDERLRLLRAVRRGSDPRHSTLLDAISWSYDLLDADEQRLFAQLAVFAGAFDLEAAESICDDEDVLDLLTRLSQRSMIAVRRPNSGGTRFEMLETLREFGRSRLDDLANVALFQAHARHFAAVAETVEREIRTPDEAIGLDRADRSFADLRSAQRFALEAEEIDTALTLITSIREYAMRTLRYEVFGWADAVAAAVVDTPHPLRPMLTALRAYGLFVKGEAVEGLALADEAGRDRRQQGSGPLGLIERVRSNCLYLMGDNDNADLACLDMIAAAEESGDDSEVAHAQYMSAIGASSSGHDDLARERYEAAFVAARRSGSPTDLAGAWTAKGFATVGDDETALDAFASADRLARSAGNRWMSAFARTEASCLRIIHGDLQQGCEGLADTVDVWYRSGEWAQQWLTLSRSVIALERIGRTDLAAQVLGATEVHTTVDAAPVMPTVRDRALETRESLVTQLGEQRFEALRTEGVGVPVVMLVHRTRHALLGLPDAG